MGRICLDYMFYFIQCVSMIRSHTLDMHSQGSKAIRTEWQGKMRVLAYERVYAFKSLLLLGAIYLLFCVFLFDSVLFTF